MWFIPTCELRTRTISSICDLLRHSNHLNYTFTDMTLETELHAFEPVLPTHDDADNVKGLLDQTECKSEINQERGSWGSRLEFLFAIVGFTVGIGSIWRFPLLCARNGGGAFIILFFFFMITCGGPLYYIEVSLGQFTGQSAGSAFEFCPLFRGKRTML